jgi:polyphosphate kinase
LAGLKKLVKAKKWLRSDRYLNREYSWLQFNNRVLEEAASPSNPPLERLKFLAIFESNLDEFYMVRVSGLIEQQTSGIFELSPDGMSPAEQLSLIAKAVQPLRRRAGEIWEKDLRPLLSEHGVLVSKYEELTERQRQALNRRYDEEIFPLCTPLLLDPAPSVPFISNRSLNLAVVLQDESGGQKLARVKVPSIVPRAVRIHRKRNHFILCEDLIRNNLQDLFPGVPILGAYVFRVIRDADIEIRELEAEDLIETIEKTIKLRRFGDPVLLEVSSEMPEEVKNTLMRLLELDPPDVMTVDGVLGLDVFWELSELDGANLRYSTYQPHLAEQLTGSKNIFATVAQTDVLVHQPFDSFRSVEQFVHAAAKDPDVIGIKQTLYRVGSESPIVESLLSAAEQGKQVAVMVELKARFDESNNLVWARALERAGAHVSYGFPDLKTHAKLCLIVRKEAAGIRSYAHIGTGNYNPTTARMYTDLGLFTSDHEVTQDIAELFNYLTGFSRQRDYRKILVAPINMREGILKLIQREITHFSRTGAGRIILKLNSLVDPEMIDALYAAGQTGMHIDLIVRGICTLKPGLPDVSKNIRVLSLVGRFLEHSRILYFENGGNPEVLIGSADLMRRNLHRRIEVLVPVTRPELVTHIRDEILESYLRDNVNTWEMSEDGSYKRRSTGGEAFSAHKRFMDAPTSKMLLPTEHESS